MESDLALIIQQVKSSFELPLAKTTLPRQMIASMQIERMWWFARLRTLVLRVREYSEYSCLLQKQRVGRCYQRSWSVWGKMILSIDLSMFSSQGSMDDFDDSIQHSRYTLFWRYQNFLEIDEDQLKRTLFHNHPEGVAGTGVSRVGSACSLSIKLLSCSLMCSKIILADSKKHANASPVVALNTNAFLLLFSRILKVPNS